MNNIKVSVIISVYNCEKYLRQCLDSVKNQSLKDIEIICVDDGSDDNSINILNEYAREDDRFIILRQNHLYAGCARNLGKSVAKGKYLMFWDADDYFDLDALSKMYLKAEEDKADICICDGRQYFEDIGIECASPRCLRRKDYPKQIPFNINTENDHIVTLSTESAWNKLFLKEFIEKYNLNFKPIRNANDAFFVICALCHAQTITIVDEQLVCYRKNKDSGLVTTVSKSLKEALNTWVDIAEYLKNNNIFPERSFANRSLESAIYLLNNTNDWNAYKQGYDFLKEHLLDLHIKQTDDEQYYYVNYHSSVVNHLYNDSAEEFSKWLATFIYNKEAGTAARLRQYKEDSKKRIIKLKKENKRLQEKVVDLEKSIEDNSSLKSIIKKYFIK